MSDTIKTYFVSVGFIDEAGKTTAQELLDEITTRLTGVKGLKLTIINVNTTIRSIEEDTVARFSHIEKKEKNGKPDMVIIDD